MGWLPVHLRAHDYLTPGSIAIVYFVLSAAWILFSDQAASAVASSLGTDPLTLQTYKGIFFIALSTLVLYSTLRIAVAAQAESERRYRTLLNEASDGIFLTDPSGRYIDVNRKACEMLGYTRAELLALRTTDVLADGPDGGIPAPADLSSGRTVLETRRVRRKDGILVPVELSMRRRDDGMVQSVMRDVSERQALEEQLRQAQKMEAVGQLTGGIAHDLNNVLATVLANASLLDQALPAEESGARADLDQIRRASQRGAEMIRKLLGFSRQSTLQVEPLDLGAVTDEVLDTLRRLLPSNITILRRGESRGVPVRADRVAFGQILINLATNARDAMPDGGTLTVAVSRTPPRGLPSPDGPQGWLEVTDTGHGMSDEVRARAFDPFFTTKPPELGSGLGLAMVYGLVRQQQGSIEVASARSIGTSVVVRFPGLAEAPERQPAPPVPTELPRGTETILLVEDEASLRSAAVRILQRLGYTVLETADGVEALSLLRTGVPVDLVISDIMMPQLDGRTLFRTLCEECHPARFLFSSGYAGEPDAASDPATLAPILAKPWTARELAAKVREVLDG